jgi:hypothetical protein
MTFQKTAWAALAACIVIVGASPQADARPVSYPGGWTFMSMNDGDANTLHLHYSPTAYTSLGYKFEHWREGEFNLHAVQMNNLLKRWNGPDSQANLYLKSGVGVAIGDDDNGKDTTTPTGFTGLATDWENRRFFASYENRFTEAGDITDFYTQSARVGVAPYIGDYGDIHTWLMVEVRHAPESDDPVTVTPLVRMFKGADLLEAGISTDGKGLFNYVHRF